MAGSPNYDRLVSEAVEHNYTRDCHEDTWRKDDVPNGDTDDGSICSFNVDQNLANEIELAGKNFNDYLDAGWRGGMFRDICRANSVKSKNADYFVLQQGRLTCYGDGAKTGKDQFDTNCVTNSDCDSVAKECNDFRPTVDSSGEPVVLDFEGGLKDPRGAYNLYFKEGGGVYADTVGFSACGGENKQAQKLVIYERDAWPSENEKPCCLGAGTFQQKGKRPLGAPCNVDGDCMNETYDGKPLDTMCATGKDQKSRIYKNNGDWKNGRPKNVCVQKCKGDDRPPYTSVRTNAQGGIFGIGHDFSVYNKNSFGCWGPPRNGGTGDPIPYDSVHPDAQNLPEGTYHAPLACAPYMTPGGPATRLKGEELTQWRKNQANSCGQTFVDYCSQSVTIATNFVNSRVAQVEFTTASGSVRCILELVKEGSPTIALSKGYVHVLPHRKQLDTLIVLPFEVCNNTIANLHQQRVDCEYDYCSSKGQADCRASADCSWDNDACKPTDAFRNRRKLVRCVEGEAHDISSQALVDEIAKWNEGGAMPELYRVKYATDAGEESVDLNFIGDQTEWSKFHFTSTARATTMDLIKTLSPDKTSGLHVRAAGCDAYCRQEGSGQRSVMEYLGNGYSLRLTIRSATPADGNLDVIAFREFSLADIRPATYADVEARKADAVNPAHQSFPMSMLDDRSSHFAWKGPSGVFDKGVSISPESASAGCNAGGRNTLYALQVHLGSNLFSIPMLSVGYPAIRGKRWMQAGTGAACRNWIVGNDSTNRDPSVADGKSPLAAQMCGTSLLREVIDYCSETVRSVNEGEDDGSNWADTDTAVVQTMSDARLNDLAARGVAPYTRRVEACKKDPVSGKRIRTCARFNADGPSGAFCRAVRKAHPKQFDDAAYRYCNEEAGDPRRYLSESCDCISRRMNSSDDTCTVPDEPTSTTTTKVDNMENLSPWFRNFGMEGTGLSLPACYNLCVNSIGDAEDPAYITPRLGKDGECLCDVDHRTGVENMAKRHSACIISRRGGDNPDVDLTGNLSLYPNCWNVMCNDQSAMSDASLIPRRRWKATKPFMASPSDEDGNAIRDCDDFPPSSPEIKPYDGFCEGSVQMPSQPKPSSMCFNIVDVIGSCTSFGKNTCIEVKDVNMECQEMIKKKTKKCSTCKDVHNCSIVWTQVEASSCKTNEDCKASIDPYARCSDKGTCMTWDTVCGGAEPPTGEEDCSPACTDGKRCVKDIKSGTYFCVTKGPVLPTIDCGAHGTSHANMDGTTYCTCDEGWTGKHCDKKCPVGLQENVCSSHGQCNLENAVANCLCDDSYMGDACEIDLVKLERDALRALERQPRLAYAPNNVLMLGIGIGAGVLALGFLAGSLLTSYKKTNGAASLLLGAACAVLVVMGENTPTEKVTWDNALALAITSKGVEELPGRRVRIEYGCVLYKLTSALNVNVEPSKERRGPVLVDESWWHKTTGENRAAFYACVQTTAEK